MARTPEFQGGSVAKFASAHSDPGQSADSKDGTGMSCWMGLAMAEPQLPEASQALVRDRGDGNWDPQPVGRIRLKEIGTVNSQRHLEWRCPRFTDRAQQM